jgi:hypothetical protein
MWQPALLVTYIALQQLGLVRTQPAIANAKRPLLKRVLGAELLAEVHGTDSALCPSYPTVLYLHCQHQLGTAAAGLTPQTPALYTYGAMCLL